MELTNECIYLCRNEEEYAAVMRYLNQQGYGWGHQCLPLLENGKPYLPMRGGGSAVHAVGSKKLFHSAISFLEQEQSVVLVIEAAALLLNKPSIKKPTLPTI